MNNHQTTLKMNFAYSIDKSSVAEVIKTLDDIAGYSQKTELKNDLGFAEAAKSAASLRDILTDAWNPKLNQLDLHSVNKQIQST